MKVWTIVFLCVAGLFGGEGCSDTPTGPAELSSDAWEFFESGKIAQAKDKFEKALEQDSELADAHSGRGWCLLRLEELGEAKVSFDRAVSRGLETADALVGRVAVQRDLPDFTAAIEDAKAALDQAPEYRFAHDPEIDYRDMRLILAQCYFALGNYQAAQEQVDLLDPADKLEPGDSRTWQVEGVTYPSYQEALLIKIERLGEELGTP